MEKKEIQPEYTDFAKGDDIITAALEYMTAAYDELTNYRSVYNVLEPAYYNSLNVDLTLDVQTTSPNIFKSYFIQTGVEIFSRGMKFPVFSINAKNRKSAEKKTIESIAKALTEWGIRSGGFEDIYQESKTNWSAYGDSYRRPYSKKVKRRKKRSQKKKESSDQMYIQFEDIDGDELLFDTCANSIKSENIANSISWWARTQIYDKNSLIRRFGKDILKHVQPGAMIDTTRMATKEGDSTQRTTDYYEVIDYQNIGDESELVLVGTNAFPVLRMAEESKQEKPKKIEKLVKWENNYPHYTSLGEPYLTLQSNHFYWDKRSVRNYGLAHKLFAPQIAHEQLENLKNASTRKQMEEIRVIKGGRRDQVKKQLADYKRESSNNIDAFLHLPQNLQGQLPETDVFRFQGVTAEQGEKSTRDVYDFARNSAGVDFNRLEIQTGVGVGQSEILEEEKTISVETIVMGNVANLRREFIGILDFIINMEGFNLDDEITYEKFISTEGRTGAIETTIKDASISVKEAAKQLTELEYDLYIDRNSIVNKSQIAMADKIINYLGVIDPAALPEVVKPLMMRLASVMRVDIPAESFEGVEKSRAMGGRSQQQSSNNNQQPNAQPVPPVPGV